MSTQAHIRVELTAPARLQPSSGAWARDLQVRSPTEIPDRDPRPAYLWNVLRQAARSDAAGSTTQARSVNGHLVYSRAGFTPAQVTAVLRHAVEDFGERAWWQL